MGLLSTMLCIYKDQWLQCRLAALTPFRLISMVLLSFEANHGCVYQPVCAASCKKLAVAGFRDMGERMWNEERKQFPIFRITI